MGRSRRPVERSADRRWRQPRRSVGPLVAADADPRWPSGTDRPRRSAHGGRQSYAPVDTVRGDDRDRGGRATPPPARPPAWRWRGLPPVLLLVASVVARLPALVNAHGVNSDAAVVGLQAMHILRGEWSWFLWGAGYQASFDAALVAAGFAITGPSALTLMVVPLIGHLVLVGLAYDVIRRAVAPAVGRAGAVLACLPLVFAPPSVNGVALYTPRQSTSGRGSGDLAGRAGRGRPVGPAVVGRQRAGRRVRGVPRPVHAAADAGGRGVRAVVGAGGPAAGVARRGAGARRRRGRGRDRVVAGPAGGRQRQGRARPGADPRELGPADRAVPAVPAGREGLRPGPATLGHVLWGTPGWLQVVRWAGALAFAAATLWAAVAVVGRVGPGPVRRLGALGVLGSGASIAGSCSRRCRRTCSPPATSPRSSGWRRSRWPRRCTRWARARSAWPSCPSPWRSGSAAGSLQPVRPGPLPSATRAGSPSTRPRWPARCGPRASGTRRRSTGWRTGYVPVRRGPGRRPARPARGPLPALPRRLRRGARRRLRLPPLRAAGQAGAGRGAAAQRGHALPADGGRRVHGADRAALILAAVAE